MDRLRLSAAMLLILLATALGCSARNSAVIAPSDSLLRGAPNSRRNSDLEPVKDERPLPPARHSVSVLLPVVNWGNLRSISPAPTDYVTEQSGRFKTDGYGIELSYHRRLRRMGPAVLFLGGDASFYLHGNERSAVTVNNLTGERERIKLAANWGVLTGSARLVWREGRRIEIHTGVGFGLYSLAIKELWDFGEYNRGEGDSTFGGFIAVGLRIPYKASIVGFRLDGKVHTANFDNLKGAFGGQEVEGPIYVLSFGASWRWNKREVRRPYKATH